MSATLMIAIITITLALVFYTIGVWSEHRSRTLKKVHLIFFWLGRIAERSMFSGGVSLHGVTGALAIILMIVHAVWATVVLWKNNEGPAKNFHKFSLVVWAIWLVPYVLGMIIGMK